MIEYKTYAEQIDILEKRGVIIKDRDIAIQLLKRHNYYNLINGYKDIFIEQNSVPEKYIDGVTLGQIYALHQFDKKLRLELSHILIIVERTVGSILAHEFSRFYPNHDLDYLNIDNYNQTSKIYNKETQSYLPLAPELIKVLNKTLIEAADRHDPMICHYRSRYLRVPLWVFINKLSFGNLAKMYEAMLPRERAAIAKNIAEISKQKLNPNDVQQAINVLSLLRNKCAHDNRIYDFDPRPMTIKSTPFTKKFLNSNNNIHSLFGALGSISLFIPENEFDKFVNKLLFFLKKLFNRLYTIPKQAILDKMGMPLSFFIENEKGFYLN